MCNFQKQLAVLLAGIPVSTGYAAALEMLLDSYTYSASCLKTATALPWVLLHGQWLQVCTPTIQVLSHVLTALAFV